MKLFNGIKLMMRKYPVEKTLFLSAFLMAIIGDVLYGGVAGAEESLVGSLLSYGSATFFSFFVIFILLRIMLSLFLSDKLYKFFDGMTSHQESTKKTTKKK
ncbi:MAG: hypothetical protein DRP42_07100 [Tenericutes bacterium]|nr:MAG: hypothetical protein DRP42_07100 [Mycoplasmatota bacterium]